ncbi:hypothetical protein ACH4LK_22470 [Streptomyces lydicus]|uniref:hypothetical protein n=1 Tax=Streptomyces lydicus TaxID=47763 RepID=UPI0037994616
MSARSLASAADVIRRAMETDGTPEGIASALESAGLLQSPAVAAEVERLRARVAVVLALLPTERCQDRGLPNEIAAAEAAYGAYGLVADALGVALPYTAEPERRACGSLDEYGRACVFRPHATGNHGRSEGLELITWPAAPAPAGPPEPNGCRYCGIPSRRPHGLQSMPGAGSHAWTAPTDEQIKARMQERRAIARAAGGERP